MSLLVDIGPLKAMEILYGGEKKGVWKGDIIKNERKRELCLPPLLKDYLQMYGYFPINQGYVGIYHPDQMERIAQGQDESDEDILILGPVWEWFAGIRYGDLGQDNPEILFGTLPEEDWEKGAEWEWGRTRFHLWDFLSLLFLENLSGMREHAMYEETDEIEQLLREYGVVAEAVFAHEAPYYTICWDEEGQQFLVTAAQGDGTRFIVLLPRLAQKEEIESPKSAYAALELSELEGLFDGEFYGNSTDCDYAHALEILLEIIRRMEESRERGIPMGEKYQLAGRCLWALEKWEEAEAWYMKAEALMKTAAAENPRKASSFYQGLGEFYHAKGDEKRYAEACEAAKRICERYMDGDCRTKGGLLQQQAVNREKEDDLDGAIELYTRALELYQQDPKGCKYDIARCQQLRGDARRKKKERDRLNRQGDTER